MEGSPVEGSPALGFSPLPSGFSPAPGFCPSPGPGCWLSRPSFEGLLCESFEFVGLGFAFPSPSVPGSVLPLPFEPSVDGSFPPGSFSSCSRPVLLDSSPPGLGDRLPVPSSKPGFCTGSRAVSSDLSVLFSSLPSGSP